MPRLFGATGASDMAMSYVAARALAGMMPAGGVVFQQLNLGRESEAQDLLVQIATSP